MFQFIRNRFIALLCALGLLFVASAQAFAQDCSASLPGEPTGTTGSSASGCSADPEAPSLLRRVNPIENEQFMHPHIPPVRTSLDGRLGINSKRDTSRTAFYLLAPEKIDVPFPDSGNGAEILAQTEPFLMGNRLFFDNSYGVLSHRGLCDAGAGWGQGGSPNPYVCTGSSDDCYDLVVIGAVADRDNDLVRVFSTPVTIRVSDPKTVNARIDSIEVFQEQQEFSPALHANDMFEPIVTEDGKLLVARIAFTDRALVLPPGWQAPAGMPPATPFTQMQETDVVYSAHALDDPNSQACRASAFKEVYPVSFAPYDPNLRQPDGSVRYDFAAFPMRDTQGNLVPPGKDLGISYPWIDRKGRNLFFTAISDTLHYQDTDDGGWAGRYPVSCPPEAPGCTLPQNFSGSFSGDSVEINDRTRGISMLGSWTHGKLVLLDGIINHTDFGLRLTDDAQRLLHLYSADGSGVAPAVRTGSGRDNRVNGPPGYMENTSFIDSLEHLFNAYDELFPVTPKEVVWSINTGHVSMELAFDDYLYPDSFIISEMVQGLEQQGSRQRSLDGFELSGTTIGRGWSGDESVRVQNAATAPLSRWTIPGDGQVHGATRIEPVALGGIRGKGLWLDGAAGISYNVAAQNGRPVDSHDWYFGIFVDPRWSLGDIFGQPPVRRTLVRFPDGSSVQLAGPLNVVLVDAQGLDVKTFTLEIADLIGDEAWTHLGFVVRDDANEGARVLGSQVDFYLNGFLFGRWQRSVDGQLSDPALFYMSPGQLHVGHIPGGSLPGVNGWIDDFKVFAFEPNREVACELAHGTLIDVSNLPAGDPWRDLAERRAPWVHAEMAQLFQEHGISGVTYSACFTDNSSDRGVDTGNVPAGTTALREAYIFPEGPLIYDQPRPDSSANEHCLLCHMDMPGRPAPLSLVALTRRTEKAVHDLRRQPTQPPAMISGFIPADHFGPGLPAQDTVAPDTGCPVDVLMLAAGPAPADWCSPAYQDSDKDGWNDAIDPGPLNPDEPGDPVPPGC